MLVMWLVPAAEKSLKNNSKDNGQGQNGINVNRYFSHKYKYVLLKCLRWITDNETRILHY